MKLCKPARLYEFKDDERVFIGYYKEYEITEEWVRDNFSAVWYTDLDGVTGLEEAITDLLSKLKGEQ